jgi:hypothetical protein
MLAGAAADSGKANWQEVALPYTWPRAVLPDATAGRAARAPWQVTWVEFDLRGLNGLSALSAAQAEDAYLYLPRWQTIGRIAVYADDRLHLPLERRRGVERLQLPAVDAAGCRRPPAAAAVGAAPAHRQPHQRGRRRVQRVGRPAAGAGAALPVAQLLQSRISEIMSVAVMGLGLFALPVWLLRRRESIYLLFAVYTLFMALRGLHYYMGSSRCPFPRRGSAGSP